MTGVGQILQSARIVTVLFMVLHCVINVTSGGFSLESL